MLGDGSGFTGTRGETVGDGLLAAGEYEVTGGFGGNGEKVPECSYLHSVPPLCIIPNTNIMIFIITISEQKVNAL